ncbi:transcriptional regulator, IclR family [Geomicrobium sp. JCM 19037]|uniref:IclR family transcriptional regulator n=1 Tax=Geomicrobium sp. JCM 19037 TaxID=1460634 RepID=UPI00045F4801|nr:IclR family transcriptional regulator [Geomicrobium sp. JCM 19037]GAK03005.1 transcriptional regulator, IclR family [Geomicrobium sp. JCM 19037]
MAQDKEIVQSVDRAMDLLFCFTTSEPVLSMKDFIEKTGLKRPTIFRLLNSLQSRGLIMKTEQGDYRLGFPFVRFAQIVTESLDVRQAAMKILKTLSFDIGESVSLNILQGNRRVCIDKVDGTQDLTHYVKLGVQYSLVKGASGKIFLAYANRGFTEEVIQEWERTNNQEIDRASYYEQLTDFKAQRVAVSKNDRVLGAYSVSSPIFDSTNQMIAALTISGHEGRLSAEMEQQIIAKVKEATSEISTKMGFMQMEVYDA